MNNATSLSPLLAKGFRPQSSEQPDLVNFSVLRNFSALPNLSALRKVCSLARLTLEG
jgi:hypothetical protein